MVKSASNKKGTAKVTAKGTSSKVSKAPKIIKGDNSAKKQVKVSAKGSEKKLSDKVKNSKVIQNSTEVAEAQVKKEKKSADETTAKLVIGESPDVKVTPELSVEFNPEWEVDGVLMKGLNIAGFQVRDASGQKKNLSLKNFNSLVERGKIRSNIDFNKAIEKLEYDGNVFYKNIDYVSLDVFNLKTDNNIHTLKTVKGLYIGKEDSILLL